MNFHDDREAIIGKLKRATVEIPAPLGKPVESPCWVPPHCVMEHQEIDNQYTSMRLNNVVTHRHVVAAALNYGGIPGPHLDLIALHHCDRKPCCNPLHVRFGPSDENLKEAIERGLRDAAEYPVSKDLPRGSAHCLAKATDEEIANIKWLWNNKPAWFPALADHHTALNAVAIFYKKSAASLKQMLRGECWKKVESIQPANFPSAESVPADAKAPLPKKESPLAAEAANIMALYDTYPDKRHLSATWL